MLFRKAFLDGIREGRITVAFRRWTRPSVRAGGTLLTPVGQLNIRSIAPIVLSKISSEDARRAGYRSLDVLLDELRQRKAGTIYRIELGALHPDPRVALRETAVHSDQERRELAVRLRRLDARAPGGPWTLRTLRLLHAHPGVRAGDLCRHVGQPKDMFKVNVRKLKALGLTESLGTGYQLSPRGTALLHAIRRLSP